MELNVALKSLAELDRAPLVLCDLSHIIVYMNPAAVKRYSKWGGASLLGKSLMDCHNEESRAGIRRIIGWFAQNPANNRVYISYNEKENRDTYMIALRDDNDVLIGYYEKHEYRTPETETPYSVLG